MDVELTEMITAGTITEKTVAEKTVIVGMFNALLGIFLLCLSACTSTEPTVLHKKVSEVNRHTTLNEVSPRKRLMILPFLDEGGTRAPELRGRARDLLIQELNKTGDLIVVDSKELKVDWVKMSLGGEYNMPEIAKTAQALGLNAILEGKLIELKVL
ncbi:MAG: hypothetical protein C5B49_04835, partial [Bdellovibrio sp.]